MGAYFSSSSQIAASTVIVDAIDDLARRFYESFGFQLLRTSANRLFLPMQTIAALI
jgi:ribosomal protein S18 acetylase RimI-like enzyme